MLPQNKFHARYNTGMEVLSILKPLFDVTSHQIREHFIQPEVVLVFAGGHPATKIVIENPSLEIFHELRTINLLLSKNGLRMKVSTKNLRKEINNLQRKVTIIVESLKGYKSLQMKLFSTYEVKNFKNFEDFEKWKVLIEENKDDLELVVLHAVQDGEISIENLRLVSSGDQDKIFNEFLSLKSDIDRKYFSEEKFFNLLHRVNASSKVLDQSFDSLIKNFQIILKNSHHLSEGLKKESLTEVTLQTLLDMLDSKYSLMRDLAKNILRENKDSIQIKFEYFSRMNFHNFEQGIYKEALGKLDSIHSKN